MQPLQRPQSGRTPVAVRPVARTGRAPEPGPASAGGRASAGGPATAELRERARTSGLLIGVLAAVIVPAWSMFDAILEPARATSFTVLRLACTVPVLLVTWLLWRHPLGRRRPELLTFVVMAVVQAEIAWMVPRVDNVEFYLLGFTLPLYASGCLLAARPFWTGALVAASWGALGLSVLTAPAAMPATALLATAIYLATASVISVLAHHRRHLLAVRELTARLDLEREQARASALLERLERLSNEDALTGLANRRRWDAELAATCAAAQERGTSVAVVLVDVDLFKQVNDRYGHAGGDLMLRDVADLLAARVRAGDLVARVGGDELALLLPGADAGRASSLAEEVRRDAHSLRPAGFAPNEVSLSLGVAVAAGDDATPHRLMTVADAQLYRAKETRNAVAATTVDAAVGLAGPSAVVRPLSA
ncbi:GGDEF domain-containing protein [Geodermatophilus sp. YIM 151500]|uniref:GGDEF domain-containing protein n=1 Tax=Geodermatophilus sp. YIM 151500 TaxID=2984531 RepID=UPI0021E3FEEB|nr:GGDEF domain-containing protein [Geodermatophilus sp. YIM 151500]MCV2490701.1 GGDEF domain-containing protein [Geodermatophilus sp. YIM 151500]